MRILSNPIRSRGVTLMELLVVMAVIGILSAIAIPAYRSYVIRVTRTDAKRDLMSAASRLERCFTRFNVYNNGACTVPATQNTPEGTYTITAEFPTATQYLLTAAPIGGQAEDAECGSFTLDQTGTQNITGTGTAVRCWTGRRG